MDGCVVVDAAEGPGDAAVVLADADADSDGVATTAVVPALELASGVLLLPAVVSYNVRVCAKLKLLGGR